MKDLLISVVIPAFNEEGSIGFVLQGVHDVLAGMGVGYEVVVVDDGSVDRTAEVAKDYNVVMIDNGGNLGKGTALRTGFLRAKGDIIVTMDADGSHHPEDIPRIVCPMINGYDVDATIGSRFVDDVGKRSTTRLHLLGNKVINLVTLFLTGRFVSDSQSGFRAFRREALRKLALGSSGYDIESEVVVKMLRNGFRIREIPIICKQRKYGTTRINSFGDGFRILKAILKATFCG